MPEEVKLAPSSRGSTSSRRRSDSARSVRSSKASEEGRRATMTIMESALKMGDWVRVVGFKCIGQIKWMGTANFHNLFIGVFLTYSSTRMPPHVRRGAWPTSGTVTIVPALVGY